MTQVVLAAAAALAAAGPALATAGPAAAAAAAAYHFSLTGPNSAQFSLPAAPTPQTLENGSFTAITPNGILAGHNTPMTLRFYQSDNEFNFGGFDIAIEGQQALNLFGDLLFDGEPSSPTFKLGTFRLFSAGVGLSMLLSGADDAAGGTIGNRGSSIIDDLDRDDFGRTYFLTISDQSTSAVPEPASWALMIGGFGLVGATMRRRRPVIVFA